MITLHQEETKLSTNEDRYGRKGNEKTYAAIEWRGWTLHIHAVLNPGPLNRYSGRAYKPTSSSEDLEIDWLNSTRSAVDVVVRLKDKIRDFEARVREVQALEELEAALSDLQQQQESNLWQENST